MGPEVKGFIGFIDIDVFNLQVAVFSKNKSRLKMLRKQGCNDPSASDEGAFASAHLDFVNGSARLSMVLKPAASKSSWAHECSHIVDFIFNFLGIPPGIESTEIRSYLLGHLWSGLEKIMPEPVR